MPSQCAPSWHVGLKVLQEIRRTRAPMRSGCRYSGLSEDEPGAPVYEFTGRVEVSRVTCSFGYYMQQNGSQVGKTPVTEELRPVSRLSIEGGISNDVVGEPNLIAIQVEDIWSLSAW